MRFVTLIAFGVWVGLVFLIYDMKYDARRLEASAVALSKALHEERENLAVARAEWSHATRPENVEKLARSVLSFEPVKPEQVVEWRQPDNRPVAASRPPRAVATAAGDGIAALIGRTVKKTSLDGYDAPR